MHFVICKYYQGLGSSRALRAAVVEASLRAPFNRCISPPSYVLSTLQGLLYLHFAYVRKELSKRVFFFNIYALHVHNSHRNSIFMLRYKGTVT